MQFTFPEINNNFSSWLFLFFLLMCGIQLCYTLFIHLRFTLYSLKKELKKAESDNYFLPVSVIICARNEEDNLSKNLPFVLEQDYPNFEVIVVNHQSSDDTMFVLKAFEEQYKNLRVIEIAKNAHTNYSKKIPLTLGIKGAKHKHLVFTDADCKPASNQWLKLIAGKYDARVEFVFGYGPYEKTEGFLNHLIRFDTAFIASNYFAFALAKMPYMGVGRNMAYMKNLFDKAHGFKSHYAIASGDDDLFVQDVSLKDNFAIQIHPDSFCYSKPKTTWKSWVSQKQRHLTTSSRYKVFHKLMLGIYPFSLLMMLISFVPLVTMMNYWFWTLVIFAAVTLKKWFVQGRNIAKLGEKTLAWWFPLMDWMYAFIMPYIYYSNEQKSKWR